MNTVPELGIIESHCVKAMELWCYTVTVYLNFLPEFCSIKNSKPFY